MKFKKFRNNYTKNSIIHPVEDIAKMSVGDLTRREKELTSQYKQIGFPTTKELQNSSNVVYVNEYTKSDGTVVHAHWRSKPEGGGTYPVNSNVVVDTAEHWPVELPRKAPDGPVDYPTDTEESPVRIILQTIFQMLPYFLQGTGNEQSLPVNLTINEGNIPKVSAPGKITNNYLKLHTQESIDPSVFVKDFADKMSKSAKHSLPKQVIAQGNPIPSAKLGNPIKRKERPMYGYGAAGLNKTIKKPYDKDIFFMGEKQAEPESINQPMAEHLSADLEQYADDLLKTSQRKNNAKFRDKLVQFLTDFVKGGLQGYSSIGTGLGKRYTNTIRQVFGKQPLSDDEIENIYAKVIGTKADSKPYKIGNIVGEIVPFITLPEVRVVSFPLIANMLLTNLYQSGLDSATQSVIDNGISPKIVTDVIKGVANSLLNTIVLHGLFKRVDKTKLLNLLQSRLKKMMNELAENFGKPIHQNDGTLVWKKAGNGQYFVERKVDYLFDINDERFCRELQVYIISETNHSPNSIKSAKEIKSINEIFIKRNFIGSSDFTFEDAMEAMQDGVIRIYSNKPIQEGSFITTSREIAKRTSQNGKGYSLMIPIKDVAFINSLEGQYAPIVHICKNLGSPLIFKGKYVNKYNNNKIEYVVNLPREEYYSVSDEIITYAMQNKIKNCEITKEVGQYIYTVILDENSLPTFIGKEFML